MLPFPTQVQNGVAGLSPTRARVGIDLASVSEVAASLDRFGDRYRRRLFTERELADCARSEPEVSARSLAARFAAKEATFKVLRVGYDQPAWTDVEVCRHPAGWCEIALHGLARTMADQAGITDLAVSLTHQGDMAGAVVFALCADPESPSATSTGRSKSHENH
jgi:holo-[acyl-carrier protein] synthase